MRWRAAGFDSAYGGDLTHFYIKIERVLEELPFKIEVRRASKNRVFSAVSHSDFSETSSILLAAEPARSFGATFLKRWQRYNKKTSCYHEAILISCL